METVDPRAEDYAVAHTTGPRADVAAVRAEAATLPIPEMAGGLVEVKLLEAFVVATRARRVLEIGTFAGVTALSLAALLPEDGELVTLEVDPGNAAIARRHFAASPSGGRIRLIEGDARESLATIDGPFDLVWIDASKSDYPAYYDAVLPKLADHGVIVADNVLRSGDVLDPAVNDKGAIALRRFADDIQADPRVDNVMLTVADGLLVIWKRPAPDPNTLLNHS
jgi:predicted O-methyltransferase YrrM